MANQLGHNPLSRGRRDGESQPLGQGDDGHVHAHHPAARVQQRTAGVARIQRGGVLDDILDQPSPVAPHRPPHGADHAGRNSRVEPQRVAHGDHQLTGLQLLRVAQLGQRQIAGTEPQQGQIGGRIVAHELRAERVAFRRNRPHPAAAMHDVAIGQGIAVGVIINPEPAPPRSSPGGPKIEITHGPTFRTTAITGANKHPTARRRPRRRPESAPPAAAGCRRGFQSIGALDRSVSMVPTFVLRSDRSASAVGDRWKGIGRREAWKGVGNPESEADLSRLPTPDSLVTSLAFLRASVPSNPVY